MIGYTGARRACAVGAVVALAIAGLAHGAPAPAAADPFAQIMAAKSVADFGRRTHDPMALLTAARLVQEVPFRKAEGEDDAGAGPAAFTPEGLLAEAKRMASYDPALVAQLTLPAPHDRGVLQSPFGAGLVRAVHEVGGRMAYAFPIKAKPGEILRIGAIGDSNTKMMMRLIGADGRLLCADDNGDYAPVCAYTPTSGGDIRVELTNHSDLSTRAVILSN